MGCTAQRSRCARTWPGLRRVLTSGSCRALLGWAGEGTSTPSTRKPRVMGIPALPLRELGAPLNLFLFFELSFEGVLGTVAGLGKIAVGAVLHGVGIPVPELAFHRVVAFLSTFVGLLRTFPAVGIVDKMIAFAFHGRPFEV